MKRINTTPQTMVKLVILVMLSNIIVYVKAQNNVGINATGTPPHPSAMLDVESTTKGFLIPRLNDSQRQSLKDPAEGLIIYNTSTNEINFWNGTQWRRVPTNFISNTTGGGIGTGPNVSINFTGAAPHHSAMLDVSSTEKGLLIPRTTPGSISSPAIGLIIYNTSLQTISYFNGSTWEHLCNLPLDAVSGTGATIQGVAINSTGLNSDPSAILDISSTNRGLLIPRMNDSQRNVIPSPAQGLLIYNNQTNSIQHRTTSNWVQEIYSGPSSPVAGNHTSTQHDITWFWNPVAGATSYYVNVVNDFSTAFNNNLTNHYYQSGLLPETTYTLYVWAVDNCGVSNVSIFTYRTLPLPGRCGGQEFMTINMNVGNFIPDTWSQSNPLIIEKWCYNDLPSNCSTYGGFYQWAEAIQEPWFANNNLIGGTWQTCDPCGSSGKQGICPSGYHIPTYLEFARYEWCIDQTVPPFYTFLGLPGYQTYPPRPAFFYPNYASGAGAKMKINSSTFPFWDGTNTSGFSAVPAGSRGSSPGWGGLGSDTYFITTTEYNHESIYYRGLNTASEYLQIFSNNCFKYCGYSVRCIKD